jgi:hypothetical protein
MVVFCYVKIFIDFIILDMLLDNLEDAYQYKSNLFIEKAYRMGMADGLKFINSL